jgi:serine/threonine protein kinase/tetratricopeptide (TPR) repeat protein
MVVSDARPQEVIDGRYRLERELSRGGMGRVFAATHVHLGTSVAVKLLESDDSPKERDRFLQEARAAAQLKHPNVVRVTDFGIDRDQQPYLVMELLEGESLRARLEREGKLDGAATAAIVDGVAKALTAAHAAGIVHRDLKPDNVWVCPEGDAKVLDFGIAKVVATASAVTTASGAMLGTPAYMSPEQAQGTKDVDASSDLWALGVVAYECLVGARPFDAEALGELVLQICAWPMPTPSQHATVPAGFDAWFAIACMRDRDLRFGSAAAQAAALAKVCRNAEHTGRSTVPRSSISEDGEVTPRVEDRASTATDRATTATDRGTASERLPTASERATTANDSESTPRVIDDRETNPIPRIRDASSEREAPLLKDTAGAALRASAGVARRMLVTVGLIVGLIVAGALAWWWSTRSTETSTTRSVAPVIAPATGPVRIAVLPRDDTSAADLATVSDTITDELIARLAGRPGVRVIARASITSLRGKPRGDLVTTANTLGADQLLLARLEKTGDRLKLSLELIAPDQTVSWTQIYSRPEAELESVCALAVSDLTAAIGAPRAAPTTTRAPAAFRAYRTGRDYWYRRDHASLVQAIRYFEDALRLDPDYVSAWVGLVDANLLLPWMGPTPRAEAYAKAKTALDRAVQLAPDASEVQAARGNYLTEADWNFAEAEQAYRKSLAIDPDNANAHQWLAEVLGFSRRFDEALAELRLAEQLDPLISAIHKIRSRTLYYAGRFTEAVAAADHTLGRDPNQPWVSYGKGYALVRLGKFDEGLAAIKADPMMQVPGIDAILKAQELWVAYHRGDKATVAKLDAELAKTSLATDWPFVAAFVAAIIDDRDRLYAALSRGIDAHDPWMPLILLNVEFDPYRNEPAFQNIAARFVR